MFRCVGVLKMLALICAITACSPADMQARTAYERTLRGIHASPDACIEDLVGQFRAGMDNSTSFVRFRATCGKVVEFFNGARLKRPQEAELPLDGGYDPPNWWKIDCDGLLVAELPVKAEHHDAFLARCPGEDRYWGYARYVD